MTSEFLVLMVLWTWDESFEILVGVNVTVLGCGVVWFGRHASKFWKNLLPHVPCRYSSQKYGYLCTKLHTITSQKTVIFREREREREGERESVRACMCVCEREREREKWARSILHLFRLHSI
jgi:hypothetical protein